MVNIKIKLLNKDCKPKYSTKGSAAMDCYANLKEPIIIEPHKVKAIPLGFALDLNHNWAMDLKPRSGLALKKQITLQNSPGLIDEDFVDEIAAILQNDSEVPFEIKPLDRICQCEVRPVIKVDWEEVDNIRSREEEHLGFGSTSV